MTDAKPLEQARTLKLMANAHGLDSATGVELIRAAETIERLYQLCIDTAVDNLQLRGVDVEQPKERLQ